MKDYSRIIQLKYNLDSTDDFALMYGPPADDPLGNSETRLMYWNLPEPPPTLDELDKYEITAEYQSKLAAWLKHLAEMKVNAWANEKVISLKILEPQLFYVAMIVNVAFRLLDWTMSGRPDDLDVSRFLITHSEAQAYREAHEGAGTPQETMSALELLKLQEKRWLQMQQGFASVVFDRRLALEKIRLALPDETLESALAKILAELLD